jgi:hypothetical protein
MVGFSWLSEPYDHSRPDGRLLETPSVDLRIVVEVRKSPRLAVSEAIL